MAHLIKWFYGGDHQTNERMGAVNGTAPTFSGFASYSRYAWLWHGSSAKPSWAATFPRKGPT